jgi:tRNA dimethylallyltransferase
MDFPKILVIVGPTATGKSNLAIELAKKFNGEIISADSRQFFIGMDIGTAKISPEERKEAPHHLIDFLPPDQHFNLYDFQKLANETIANILKRGKLPIVVGGTGLYISALIENYDLQSKNYTKLPPLYDFMMIMPDFERAALYERINLRVKQMMESDLENEVRFLVEKYGTAPKALNTIGYKEFFDYLKSPISKDDLLKIEENIAKNTRNYAKRQVTWFNRYKDKYYVHTELSETVSRVEKFIVN